MFGGTLLNRKIVTTKAFGIIFGGGVGCTIVFTVLMQEIWIPFVSTQRLYMPCPEPPVGTWQHTMATNTDLSPILQRMINGTRNVIHHILSVPLLQENMLT